MSKNRDDRETEIEKVYLNYKAASREAAALRKNLNGCIKRLREETPDDIEMTWVDLCNHYEWEYSKAVQRQLDLARRFVNLYRGLKA